MEGKFRGTINRFSRWVRRVSDEDIQSLSGRRDSTHKPSRRRGEGVSSYHVLEGEEVALSKKPSIDVSLPHLTSEEQIFFSLIESGNIRKVKDFLASHEQFNINCTNYQGFSALVMAVKNEDIDMVKYLLDWDSLDLGDCFLHAIDTGNLVLVETVLTGCMCIPSRSEVEFNAAEDNSIAFPPGTTPLMLAAHRGHYEIIRFLIHRGHAIEYPHPPTCHCDSCQMYMEKEGLADARVRLNVYRAIASPPYICQSSDDPILTAFELCSELKLVAQIEREFSHSFLELADKCSKFAVDILDQCRSTQEVDILLHRREGLSRSYVRPGWRFTRVGLAVYHDQKEFVAHSSCQQALRSAWLEGFPKWKRLSVGEKFLRLIPRVLIIPFMVLLHIVIPRRGLTHQFSRPLQKYISSTVSYFCFLCLLIAQTTLDSHKNTRGPPDTGLEWCIILYVVAFLFQNLKAVWNYGLSNYIRHKWNVYDLTMITVFLAAFVCWGWSTYELGDITHISYTQRRYWSAYDSTLIGEAVYSVATVMAFGRITFFFQISTGIGPLQLSFSRMFNDIANFFFIFLAIMTAFAIGLYKLYHNYEGMVKAEGGEIVRQEDAFTTVENTMATLYWALYGYGGPSYADLVVSEYMERDGNETVIIYNHHRVTEMVGRTIYAVYHIAGLIILFNMLIAMMTASLDSIQSNADAEWKFNRTRVWMTFLQKGGTLPPPFNIIPTPKLFWLIGEWIVHRMLGSQEAKCSQNLCCYMDRDQKTKYERSQEQKAYTHTMAYLVQRYLTSKSNIKDESHATKEDIEAVRYHLRDLRDTVSDLSEEILVSRGDSLSKVRHKSSSTVQEQESNDSVFLQTRPTTTTAPPPRTASGNITQSVTGSQHSQSSMGSQHSKSSRDHLQSQQGQSTMGSEYSESAMDGQYSQSTIGQYSESTMDGQHYQSTMGSQHSQSTVDGHYSQSTMESQHSENIGSPRSSEHSYSSSRHTHSGGHVPRSHPRQ